MRVFLDTSALLALAARKDSHHAAATAYLQSLPAGTRLVTSDYVFDEFITRLRRLEGHSAAMHAGEALRSSQIAKVERITEKELEMAWVLFSKYRDQHLSHTDCTVAAMVKARAVPTVFAFDADFRRIGLPVKPS